MKKLKDCRADFPLLSQTDAKGREVAYLDNAATTQKPRAVLEAADAYYRTANANPHRGVYDLSVAATGVMEGARERVRAFLGAGRADEIVFTKNATEALNLIAHGCAAAFLKPGDGVVAAVSEHHSNLVPWQVAARAAGARLTYLYTDREGRIPEREVVEKIVPGVKIVAVAQVSNLTGVVHPVAAIAAAAHRVGALVVVDGTQAAPHMPVNVQALDADFYALSAHKLCGPMGAGALYGKAALLEQIPPLLTGGDMIDYVEEQSATYAPAPQKFEGGTQDVGALAGFSAALDYLDGFGMEAVAAAERELTGELLDALQSVPHLHLVGPAGTEGRIGVASFVMDGAHPHDIATILNADGVAVRSGHHCAQPLLHHLGLQATCRASVYIYNTREDIRRLADSLRGVRRWLGYGAE